MAFFHILCDWITGVVLVGRFYSLWGRGGKGEKRGPAANGNFGVMDQSVGVRTGTRQSAGCVWLTQRWAKGQWDRERWMDRQVSCWVERRGWMGRKEIRWRWLRSDRRNEWAVDTHRGRIQQGVEDDGGDRGGGDGWGGEQQRASAMVEGRSDRIREPDEGRRMKGRAWGKDEMDGQVGTERVD